MNLPRPIADFIDKVLPHMEGWCTVEKATALAEAVLDQKPLVFVEIGVFAGRSLITAALACEHNQRGRVIGIDPWTPEASESGFSEGDANRVWWAHVDHSLIFKLCRDFVNGLGVAGRVDLVRTTSEWALPGLKLVESLFGKPIVDFLHIDGNHSEECSTYDVEHYVPLVVPGGTVWFDDTDWTTTKKAQTMLDDLCEKVGMVGTCGIYKRKEA